MTPPGSEQADLWHQLALWVPGTPITQGSMRSIGKGRMLHDKHEELNAWRDSIGTLWRAEHGLTEIAGGIRATLEFVLPRFKSVSRVWPVSQRDGDLDKLARAVYDALEGVAYANDAQVFEQRHEKMYLDAGDSYGTGVRIWLKWRIE